MSDDKRESPLTVNTVRLLRDMKRAEQAFLKLARKWKDVSKIIKEIK